MRLTLITILTFGLFACTISTGKKTGENETVKDSLVSIDNSTPDNKETMTNNYSCCDFDKFVNDPRTPKLAKDIYLDNEWDLTNDEVLTYLDSLTAKDKSSRPFYFKVVTKSEKKADGYYAEGLGNAGYEYVLNNTQEFASYFDMKQCNTENDLTTWVDIVMLEISLIVENENDKTIVDNYINKIKSNCKECSTSQKETINKFSLILDKEWRELLKHLD